MKGIAMDEQQSSVSISGQQRTALKPVAELTDKEIVAEARDLHAHFQQLVERFQHAPASERAEIRAEMKPVASRERELRQEASGRLNPEMSQDRVPEVQISYSR
jgi:hypothetical protein